MSLTIATMDVPKGSSGCPHGSTGNLVITNINVVNTIDVSNTCIL
jgi:hypothetical protein